MFFSIKKKENTAKDTAQKVNIIYIRKMNMKRNKSSTMNIMKVVNMKNTAVTNMKMITIKVDIKKVDTRKEVIMKITMGKRMLQKKVDITMKIKDIKKQLDMMYTIRMVPNMVKKMINTEARNGLTRKVLVVVEEAAAVVRNMAGEEEEEEEEVRSTEAAVAVRNMVIMAVTAILHTQFKRINLFNM